MAKSIFSSQICVKVILYMAVMVKNRVEKTILYQKIIWISGYHLMMLWKGYKNLDFSQNSEGIFGVIHQRIRNGIP